MRIFLARFQGKVRESQKIESSVEKIEMSLTHDTLMVVSAMVVFLARDLLMII